MSAGRRQRRRKRARGACLRAVLLAALACMGCSQFRASSVIHTPPASAAAPRAAVADGGRLQQAQYTLSPAEAAAPAPKVLPISLDTVFRLAEDHNGQVQLARAKLQEAYAERALADKAWLPDIFLGGGYYRHEGGIQDEDGRLLRSSFGSTFGGLEAVARVDVREAAFQRISAERKVWQQRGELSRLTSEALLDAASTYIDLLAALHGERASAESEKQLRKLLAQAEKLAAADPGVQVEVIRIRTQLLAQEYLTRKLQKGARAASARLAHLLGLDPEAQLAPLEPRLVPIRLVPPEATARDLIAQAQSVGPGVQELEGLLAILNSSQEKAKGIGQFLPVFEVRMAEGGFGAGPGAQLDWVNRFDASVTARWNVTSLATVPEKKRLAWWKARQAHLGYDNLRSQLALGVAEAFEESMSSAAQIELGREQVRSALSAHKVSEERFLNSIKGSSPSEVLLSIQALAGARLNYLNALRDFNKAQVRLFVLTGAAASRCAP